MMRNTFPKIIGFVLISLALAHPMPASAQTSRSTLTISGQPPATVVAQSEYRFSPSVSGGRGTRRFFWVQGKPAWATFSGRTGMLVGTPTAAQVGEYANIRIFVGDGRSTASLPLFSIKVTTGSAPANRAPVLSGSPTTTVIAGTAYAFQPTATDADGDSLSFSIQSKPVWASFSPSTGRLSGTPAPTQAGTTSGIVIIASDGKTTTSLPSFSIQVVAATVPTTNKAPTITGSPAQGVLAGQPYNFQPVAADADGDTIAFGISNKPAWASFSTTTGRLYGTPSAVDVGAYANVVIAVSDTKASATLPAFGIVVTQVSNGSATLTWTAPTLNSDGSPLTNLAGFRIDYGTSATSLTQTITVSNPGLTSYVVENLVPGTWYFTLSAYNSAGVASTPSGAASKAVQ